MSFVKRTLQKAVSGKRNRYVADGFDLDLTYITDRIIAAGLPAEGFTGIYRNSLHDISTFLHQQHNDHFKVWNLSERSYDYSKFDNMVVEYGWFDYHSPPLHLLFKICSNIHEWLTEHPKNVAIIHCIAGKGRTGTAIACYLLYSGVVNTAQEAIFVFDNMRGGKISSPSQRRYIEYFGEVINSHKLPAPKEVYMKKIIIHHIPNVDYRITEAAFSFEVYNIALNPENPKIVEKTLVYNSHANGKFTRLYCDENDGLLSLNCNLRLKGDILILCKYHSVYSSVFFRLALHTGLIPLEMQQFKKHDLDETIEDKTVCRTEFSVDIIFGGIMDTDADKPTGFIDDTNPVKSPGLDQNDSTHEDILYAMAIRPPIVDGSICFMNEESPHKLKTAELLAIFRDTGIVSNRENSNFTLISDYIDNLSIAEDMVKISSATIPIGVSGPTKNDYTGSLSSSGEEPNIVLRAKQRDINDSPTKMGSSVRLTLKAKKPKNILSQNDCIEMTSDTEM